MNFYILHHIDDNNFKLHIGIIGEANFKGNAMYDII